MDKSFEVGLAMNLYSFHPGTTPLILSMPHVGTDLPPAIADRLTPEARSLPDTDWHVDRLYAFAEALGAGILKATQSRYVVDLNRAPDGKALYAGASNTELVPTTTFEDRPIYRVGQGLGEGEAEERRARYWQPYHDRLAAELDRVRSRFGMALLFDAHSIRSQCPRFFEGRLPDLNIGTGGGASADPLLAEKLLAIAAVATPYSSVLNGRFKGGYITRHYGKPAEHIQAVQLELAQIAYMDEDAPYTFRCELAERLRPTLRCLLLALLEWARARQPARARA
jgi:N-formylglutamate deformylase